jgi:uncharacterized protein
MPQHGDWKQLFRAAGEGQVEEMVYHLENGVDPNFQHPEYMSSILCEACRAGQVAAVRLLLQRGANPFLPEDYSGDLPLQIALAEHRHAVVDVLLQYNMDHVSSSSPAFPSSTIVQAIWMDTDDASLVQAVTCRGHCVIWPGAATEMVAAIRAATGNHKVFSNHDDDDDKSNTQISMTGRPIVDVVFLDNRHHRSVIIDKTGEQEKRFRTARYVLAQPLSSPTHHGNRVYEVVAMVEPKLSWWWRWPLSVVLLFRPNAFVDAVVATIFPARQSSAVEF